MPISVLPGVYVGSYEVNRQTQIIVPSDVYMVGLKGTGGTVGFNVPTSVSSVADFVAKFGTGSPSLPDVTAHFNQSNVGLKFVATEFTTDNSTQREMDFKNALDSIPDSVSGILVCPRGFMQPASDISYTGLVTRLRTASERTGLFLILDVPVGMGSSAVNAATFVSAIRPIDNCAVYFPYITQGSNLIPPSSAMASIILSVIQTSGMGQPPAGSSYPVRGATVANTSRDNWETLFNLGVNVIINRRGTPVPMGVRTINAERTFINTAIIVSSVRASLYESADSLVFAQADNRGQLFTIATNMATSVMMQFFNANALSGATPRDSFNIVCDGTNNTIESLNSGVLNLRVEMLPATAIERVVIEPTIMIQ